MSQHVSHDLEQQILAAIQQQKLRTCKELAAYLDEAPAVVYQCLTSMTLAGRLCATETPDGPRAYAIAKPAAQPTRKPFAELSYDEVSQLVLEAIDARCHTLGQLKRHTGFEACDDVSEVLLCLQDDGIIERVDNGNITAFFRFGAVPSRFWSEGDVCGVEFADPAAEEEKKRKMIEEKQRELDANPRPIARTQIDEIRGVGERVQSYLDAGDDDLNDAELLDLETDFPADMVQQEDVGLSSENVERWDALPETQPAAEPEASRTVVDTVVQHPQRKGRAAIPIDPDAFRAAAIKHSGNQKKIAAELGIGVSTLWKKLSDPELRSIYDEVVAMRSDETPAPAEQVHDRALADVTNVDRTNDVPIDSSPSETSDDATAAPTSKGLSDIPLPTPRGKTCFPDYVTRRIPSLDELTPEKVVPRNQRSAPSRKEVGISSGTLNVSFTGNFFDASPAERDLLNKIADLLQEHQHLLG
jgi:hypothetical protein